MTIDPQLDPPAAGPRAARPAGQGMVVLHIGLPKTATTFLQHRIFRRARRLRFVHRRTDREADRLCAALRRYTAAASFWAPGLRRRLVAQLAARAGAGPPGCLLLSDENVSVLSSGFWSGKGPVPDRVAARLGALGAALDGRFGPLRVIIGIRRQDQWLGSRYAESAKAFPGFGQADFERRMRGLAEAEAFDGVHAWLDFAAVQAAFAEALGPENLLLVPMERLADAPHETLGGMGAFLGGIDLLRPYAAAEAKGGGLRRNALSAGDNVWRLRRDEGEAEIVLDPALQAALRARFAACNRLVAERLRGFGPAPNAAP
jgi:hypothetical protein